MRHDFLFFLLLLFSVSSFSQTLPEKLSKAISQLEKDSDLLHAIVGFCVADSETGKILYEKKSNTGLAPASTQKIFTSIASYELLGKDYRFRTQLGYTGKIADSSLQGDLRVIGFGDPTLGSDRFSSGKVELYRQPFFEKIKQLGIKNILGDIVIDNSRFSAEAIPDGWIWEDIGNYYAAGHWAINWKENSFDLLLRAGDTAGDSVLILDKGPLQNIEFQNLLSTGVKNSGDNAFIHLAPDALKGYLSGTIPAGEKKFTISGAVPNGPDFFITQLRGFLQESRITLRGSFKKDDGYKKDNPSRQNVAIIYSSLSPSLDSISYYFLHKSINLYGEALIRTIAYEKDSWGTTEKGVALVKQFFEKNGIDPYSINIFDGSGLSPQNRVTPQALVKALMFARKRPWFNSFLYALPELNGLKMKSGSIEGARAFAGFSKASNGNHYTFSFIINNYNGSGGAIVRKMYKVLDILK